MSENEIEDTFEIDGKNIKPNIIKTDINQEMKKRAYNLAFESMQKYNVEKDMADYIKQHFDEEYLESWQCVAGKDFAVSLSHESENFIFFSIEKTFFLLFKI
jgi:dynein light chain LC8-type